MQFPLTKKQAAAKAFIAQYIAANGGVSPSYAEIADGIGVNDRGSVSRLITALEERGHIRRLPNRARSIAVIE